MPRSWRVRLSALAVARSMVSAMRVSSVSSFTRSFRKEALPWMLARMFLKSWAKPPARLPMDSSFWGPHQLALQLDAACDVREQYMTSARLPTELRMGNTVTARCSSRVNP